MMPRKAPVVPLPNPQQMKDLITPAQAAKWLGAKPDVLAQWRYRGEGPAFVRFNERNVRYRPSVVRDWIASRETSR